MVATFWENLFCVIEFYPLEPQAVVTFPCIALQCLLTLKSCKSQKTENWAGQGGCDTPFLCWEEECVQMTLSS